MSVKNATISNPCAEATVEEAIGAVVWCIVAAVSGRMNWMLWTGDGQVEIGLHPESLKKEGSRSISAL